MFENKMIKSDMKRIFSMLTATLMLAGTALWSGCSQNEEMDHTPAASTEQAGSFTFSLKNNGAATRATQDANDYEKEIKTMYVAFFIQNDGQDDTQSLLHRVFFYDANGSGDNVSWGVGADLFEEMKITEAQGKYTIQNPGFTGNYLAYFIANPEAEIITQLQKYQKNQVNGSSVTLQTLKEGLIAAGDADGGTGAGRGFTMVSGMEAVTVGDGSKEQQITLTRLAARFDFTNSAPTLAKIESVQFINEAKKSYVVSQANIPAEATKAGDEKEWTNNNTPKTVYVYENLNVEDQTNVDYTFIKVKYQLKNSGDANFGETKTLEIRLKEKDTNLAVLRNHLYKIYLNCITGTYTLEVKDWEEGETVTIPNQDLAITYTADSLEKIGDYVYVKDGKLAFSDGGLRKMYLDGSLEWDANISNIKADPSKGTCIGILFSRNASDKDKAANYKRGYVMALKNVENGINLKWCTTNYDTGIGNFKVLGSIVNYMDGFTDWQTLKAEATAQSRSFPLLKAAADYTATTTLPASTSGWYAPSIGQLCAIMNLCGYNYNVYSNSTFTISISPKTAFSIYGFDSTAGALNTILKNSSTNANDYNLIENIINYASSTEHDARNFNYINTYITNGLGNQTLAPWGEKTKAGMPIRPVFAY